MRSRKMICMHGYSDERMNKCCMVNHHEHTNSGSGARVRENGLGWDLAAVF